jgi:hypothetical protein
MAALLLFNLKTCLFISRLFLSTKTKRPHIRLLYFSTDCSVFVNVYKRSTQFQNCSLLQHFLFHDVCRKVSCYTEYYRPSVAFPRLKFKLIYDIFCRLLHAPSIFKLFISASQTPVMTVYSIHRPTCSILWAVSVNKEAPHSLRLDWLPLRACYFLNPSPPFACVF